MPDETKELSDKNLVHLAQAGSEQAFEEIYRRHCVSVTATMREYSSNPQDVEEGVQETFTRAFANLYSFGSKGTYVKSWLKRIGRNLMLDKVRRVENSRRSNASLDDVLEVRGDPLQEIDPNLRLKIQGAYEKLSLDRQRLIYLRLVEGRTYPEIREITGLSHTTLSPRIFRARTEMKERLQEYR